MPLSPGKLERLLHITKDDRDQLNIAKRDRRDDARGRNGQVSQRFEEIEIDGSEWSGFARFEEIEQLKWFGLRKSKSMG